MADATRGLSDFQGNTQKIAYDLSGDVYTLKVLATSGGTGASADQVQGAAANDAVIVGNPLYMGAVARNAYATQVANGDAVGLMATRAGTLITKADAPPELEWSALGTLTTTASTAVKALAAGLRQCLKGLQISTATDSVSTTLTILDGTTPVWSVVLPAGAGTPSWTFPTPVKSTAGAALNIALGTIPVGAVLFNAQGFAQP